MNPKVLAQALKATIKEGLSVDEAVKNFVEALRRRGMLRILSKVAYEFELLEKREMSYKPTMSVARESDFDQAFRDSGVDTSNVVKKIDDTLIGGYKVEQGGELTDTSYKRQLLDIFYKIKN